jgi:hypothetical protein
VKTHQPSPEIHAIDLDGLPPDHVRGVRAAIDANTANLAALHRPSRRRTKAERLKKDDP